MGEFRLKTMRFYAHHGAFAEERQIGGYYEVDVTYTLDAGKAEQDDDITETVNYQEIYDTVKEEMNKSSKLIENVSRRIADSIKRKFKQIDSIELTLSKMTPPLGGDVERVTYTIKL